jgi:exodeoxyribonuclease V alpha subunit
MSHYFSGRVHSVVFANEGNAFYIVRMVLDHDDDGVGMLMKQSVAPVSVKGNVPGIKVAPGAWFGFEGKWTNHEKFGKQLDITRAPVLKDGWDADKASKTLVANGVGATIVESILSHFGEAEFIAALEDPPRLQDVPGLAKFSAMHVASRWESVKAHFKALEFLNSFDLPSGLVRDIWTHFGDEAERMLTSNPWSLVEVDGITFQQADEVARKLGLVDEDAQVRGAVLYACKSGRGFGHLYLQTGAVFHSVRSMVAGTEKKVIAKALAALHREGLLVIDKKARPGTTAVYEPWSHTMESLGAELLVQREKAARLLPSEERTDRYLKDLGSVGPLTEKASKSGRKKGRLERVVRVAIEEWGSQANLVLSEPQKDGIFNALTAPVSVLSGLPGTGKTTSLRAAVRVLQDASVPFLLCAPTGIAAKNLSALTGAPASTIHRAFAAKGSSDDRRARTYAGVTGQTNRAAVGVDGGDGWGYGPDNPHPADVVIIDEASMVDQHLIFRLLDCTKPDARLVLVGDHAQLPSVGPGNVLRDLIASELFPTIKLTQIFRQDDTSGIVYAAHAMVNGDVPETDKDFRLIAIRDEEEVLDAILKIGVKFHAAGVNFQILSPKHRGTVGVTNLNARLRELLNPAAPGLAEMRLGKDTVREGDRVMVIKNDYKLGVYNGDVGKVALVDRAKKVVQIQIFGAPPLLVNIEFKHVPKLLVLAYACTVHKSQGLEYDRIVMPLVRGFYHQLQRNLLYTAITRAKKQVVLVGHHEALATAVHNAKQDERATLFLDRIVGGLLPAVSE